MHVLVMTSVPASVMLHEAMSIDQIVVNSSTSKHGERIVWQRNGKGMPTSSTPRDASSFLLPTLNRMLS